MMRRNVISLTVRVPVTQWSADPVRETCGFPPAPPGFPGLTEWPVQQDIDPISVNHNYLIPVTEHVITAKKRISEA